MARGLVSARLWALAFIVLAGCSDGVAARHNYLQQVPSDLGAWERWTRLYLESDGTGFVTANDSAAGTADAIVLESEAGAALRQTGSYHATGTSTSWTFTMRKPLNATHWLNLSKPITGVVYLSNSLSQAIRPNTDRGVETSLIRVEVLQAERRVGSTEFTFNARMAAGQQSQFGTYTHTWSYVPFSVRAEQGVLEEGQKLSLRFTQLFGASELMVGSGESHQSWVEFRYFDFDPLAGILYAEGGRLVSSSLGQSLTSAGGHALDDFLDRADAEVAAADARGDPAGIILLPPAAGERHPTGGLLALGSVVVVVAPRRRRRVGLVVGLLAVGALAGCFGAGPRPNTVDSTATPTDPSTSRASVATVLQENETLRQSGHGALAGRVLAEGRRGPEPIIGATVILLRTPNFGTTDEDGRFFFANVSEGEWLLRIEAKGYDVLETMVRVEVGAITQVNITMALPSGRGAGARPHAHPMWPEEGRKTVLDETFTPPDAKVLGLVPTQPVPGQWICTNTKWPYPVESHFCAFEIRLKPPNVVWPGTGLVEVELDWTGLTAPRELGLHISTPANTTQLPLYGWTNLAQFAPRGPEDPFRMALFPNEADGGHATQSQWAFWVYTPVDDQNGLPRYVVPSIQSVHARITIHKGVVPLEPSHDEHWRDGNQILMIQAKGTSASSLSENPNDQSAWRPQPITYNKTLRAYDQPFYFVPAGTGEIRGQMHWNYTDGQWGLAYRSANRISTAQDPGWRTAEVVSRNPKNITFLIRVQPEEWDTYYQKTSYWYFAPDDLGQPPTANDLLREGLLGGGGAFSLTASAIRNPAFIMD